MILCDEISLIGLEIVDAPSQQAPVIGFGHTLAIRSIDNV